MLPDIERLIEKACATRRRHDIEGALISMVPEIECACRRYSRWFIRIDDGKCSLGDRITQVSLELFRKFHCGRFPHDCPWRAAVATVARSNAINLLRYLDTRRGLEEPPPNQGNDAADAPPESLDKKEAAERLIERLRQYYPNRDVLLVWGRVFDGQSFSDLASGLGFASAHQARARFNAIMIELCDWFNCSQGEL